MNIFKPTLQDIKINFYDFNNSFFYSSLAMPVFCIADFSWDGQFWVDDDFSYIALRHCFKSEEEFMGTLAHEMIHLWQQQNGYKVNHKKKFKKWANMLKTELGVEVR